MFDLNGHTAIVTGAARGIGAGIARRLSQAGASVCLVDKNQEAAEATAATLQASGADVWADSLDITDPAAVNALVARVIERAGQLHILVNNAGIGGKAAPIAEQSDADWDSVIAVNMTAVFYLCRAAMPHMIERNYGRIVNIASLAGKEGNPNMVAYSASKSGVIALSKSLGKETAQYDICCNAVSPTVIGTPLLEQLTPEQVNYMTSKIPRGRMGKVEEVAAVAHFLASPDCSFVTGQCYDVSGGRATY